MNLWVAFLNLENTYGTQESLMKVFERSVAYNDPKKMYLHLVKIFERANKIDVSRRSLRFPRELRNQITLLLLLSPQSRSTLPCAASSVRAPRCGLFTECSK